MVESPKCMHAVMLGFLLDTGEFGDALSLSGSGFVREMPLESTPWVVWKVKGTDPASRGWHVTSPCSVVGDS